MVADPYAPNSSSSGPVNPRGPLGGAGGVSDNNPYPLWGGAAREWWEDRNRTGGLAPGPGDPGRPEGADVLTPQWEFVDTEWRSNPPMHPSRSSRENLTHGYIRRYNDATVQEASVGGVNVIANRAAGGVQFNFAFNPSRMGLAWTMNSDMYNAALQDPGGNVQGSVAPEGNASVDFQVLVDRFPETVEGTMPGVLGDLMILEYVASARRSGVLEAQPIELKFGGPGSFHMWGLMPSMGIELTHYSPSMIPMRAVVSFSLQRISRVHNVLAQDGTSHHDSGIAQAQRERDQAEMDRWLNAPVWNRGLTFNTPTPIQYGGSGGGTMRAI